MLWEQTGLRWHLYKDRRELHFSPIAEGVLFPPCPQVITVHDALPLYDTTFMPRWVPYYQYVLPLLIRQSTATVCISEFTRQELLRLDPKLPQHKLRVIPPGVNQERFFPGNPEAAFKRWGLQGYLLMVGEGRPYKNPEVVVRALAELKQAVPLAICGRMPEHERARVEQIAREAGVLEQIRWLGYVSDAELRDLYTGALAFVFPSRYEGFGLPTLEAMSCGAPVLSSNAASLPEAGGSAALYFSPDNPSALAELIHLLHTEPERRELMREAGLRHAEKFTWERSAKQHLELFEEALYARY
ncbi:MAG: glycosyltransferase family 4 protein [bacterium]